MNLKTIQYVSMPEYCEATGKDYTKVMDEVSSSDISFGTNAETFMTAKQLADILEETVPEGISHNLMIALGS